MIKSAIGLIAGMLAIGCANPPAGGTTIYIGSDAFVGTWRSVTPSLEFVRLAVYSTSSEQGAIAARLTLSGVQYDAAGRVSADSMVGPMTPVGGTSPTGTLAMHAGPTGAANAQLTVQLRPDGAAPQNLTFVKE